LIIENISSITNETEKNKLIIENISSITNETEKNKLIIENISSITNEKDRLIYSAGIKICDNPYQRNQYSQNKRKNKNL
jgi:hypothetical protein